MQQGKIVFGLTAIKGVGRGAAEDIVRARAAGKAFKDLFDLCERIDLKQVPKAALERLIKAGAMDSLQGHRAQLLLGLPRAIQAATDRQNDMRLGQGNLFDGFGAGDSSTADTPTLPETPPWPETEKLKYEKEALDFYFSSHPLALFEKDLRRFSSHNIADLKGLPADQEITIGGMLSQVRLRQGKRGGTFAAFTLEDFTGSIESVIWSDCLEKNRERVQDDEIVIARGSLKRDRESPVLVIMRLILLKEAAQEMAKELWLRLKVGTHRLAHIDALAEILRKTPGGCPVFLAVEDTVGKKAALRLGRAFGVNPATYPHTELEDLLGTGSVKLR